VKDVPMRVNRMNVEAIELLSQDRNFEADRLLQQALSLEPQNAFTINNLGVANEATGDYDAALKYYDQAAASHSSEPVVVTLKRSWRGKPVSEMASDSARELRKRMKNNDSAQARATMLAFRGVSALNRNDWSTAKQDFLEAYKLDPDSAFSLNNRGYVAEKDGDLETAQFYYSKARKAEDADARVGLATERSAEGKHLVAVAAESHLKVGGELEQYSQAARRETGPVELIRRNNSTAEPNASPNKPSVPVPPRSGPQPVPPGTGTQPNSH
jgi:Flp pilus assembly protein TadD